MKLLLTFWVGCAIVLTGTSGASASLPQASEEVKDCRRIGDNLNAVEAGLNAIIDAKLQHIKDVGGEDGLVYAFDTLIEAWELRMHAHQYLWEYADCTVVLYNHERSKELAW